MLSVFRLLAARTCQHITELTASRSQGLTRPQRYSSPKGTQKLAATVSTHRIPPAVISPALVLGNSFRSPFSRAEISLPMSTTGWGMLCGSPTRQSRRKPSRRERKISFRICCPYFPLNVNR